MTMREKIEGLTRHDIVGDIHGPRIGLDPRGDYLERSEVLAAVEEWEALQRPIPGCQFVAADGTCSHKDALTPECHQGVVCPAKPAPPVGQAGGVQEPADEFRPGLPAEALRRAHDAWEDSNHWARAYLWRSAMLPSLCEAYEIGFRPHGSTWSAVELLAARALGEEDGKAGREPMEDYQLARALHGGRVAGPENRDAYRTAYAAAKGTT